MDESAELHEDLKGILGQTIAGRYRVDGLIGIGGMGAVFRGHHLGLKRDVAIKILHPELSRDSQISARFDREAHSASRLDHPNCMQVTDYGSTDDGMQYMVMQLLEGWELSEVLTEKMAPPRAVALVLQIMRGLEHAHERGIVHRDLKPENVFVTNDHEGKEILKLVDFGIAKIVSGTGSEEPMTKMGLVFGTPKYMSPEQATGSETDERTDLYSAGVILYQMLAGEPPFHSDDPIALVRMQVSVDPPPLPADIPIALRDLCMRLLAKKREERLSSALEAREILEAFDAEFRADRGPVPTTLAPTPSLGIPLAKTTGEGDVRRFAAVWAGITEQLKYLRPEDFKALAQRIGAHGLRLWNERRREVLIAGGSLVALTAVCAVWPSDEDPAAAADDGVEVAADAPEALPDPVETEDKTDPDDRLAELDRLILAKDTADAQILLQKMRDASPDDAMLLWRQGRLLTQQKRKKGAALDSYGEAMEREPKLLEDKDFYAELMALMRESRLQQQALDLALRKMGGQGHTFLLELVNRKQKAIDFNNRHRILEELRRSDESAALIDVKLNIALDLFQAKQSLTPCKSYGAALEAIKKAPDPYYVEQLDQAKPPDPSKSKSVEDWDAQDLEACPPLEAQRLRLLGDLEMRYPEAKTGKAK